MARSARSIVISVESTALTDSDRATRWPKHANGAYAPLNSNGAAHSPSLARKSAMKTTRGIEAVTVYTNLSRQRSTRR